MHMGGGGTNELMGIANEVGWAAREPFPPDIDNALETVETAEEVATELYEHAVTCGEAAWSDPAVNEFWRVGR